jgi:transcriptional regulator with XRE-family HTH domain
MIHIGKKIKEKVSENQLSLADFAKALNKSRPLIYNIFERKSIDTALLQKISDVLGFNFFSLYIPTKESSSIENGSLEELKIQLDTTQQALNLAKMELEYLKKINSLLEERNR